MQESIDPRGLSAARLFGFAFAVTAVAFFVDQASKFLGRGLPSGVGPFPQLLTPVLHENYGLIANLPVPLPIIVAITVGVLAVVFWMLVIAVYERRVLAVMGLGMLLGGAFGNLFDRLTLGYVFDWILLFGRSALNLADLFIFSGALIYILGTQKLSTTKTDTL